jgi:hypothetical protein
MQKDQQMMLQTFRTLCTFMIGLVVFLFLIALIYAVGYHVTITNLVMILIALVLGVSCLLTLAVNKRDVILNNALFFFHLLGSIEADKMVQSTFCLKYRSQFINHEILTISGIRWYIADVLMHFGFVSSVDQVLNCNHSEYLTSYVDKEAIRIHQTCYHDTRYFSFKIMDYDGPDSVRGLMGMILLYDNICHQYNVVINIIKNSMTEHQCALSPSVMEPVNLLPNKMNWSSYHLSRGSKKSRADVVKLNLP